MIDGTFIYSFDFVMIKVLNKSYNGCTIFPYSATICIRQCLKEELMQNVRIIDIPQLKVVSLVKIFI